MTSFTPGDHVAILTGWHAGDIGTVVAEPSLRGVPVHRDGTPDGHVNYYDPNQLVLDLAVEGGAALAAEVWQPEAIEDGGPLPRRAPRLTLGQFWAAQVARRSPADAPIAYALVERPGSSNVVTLSFGGVA